MLFQGSVPEHSKLRLLQRFLVKEDERNCFGNYSSRWKLNRHLLDLLVYNSRVPCHQTVITSTLLLFGLCVVTSERVQFLVDFRPAFLSRRKPTRLL